MNISTSNIRYRLKEKIQLHLKEQKSQGFNDDRGIANQVDPQGSRTTEDQIAQETEDLENQKQLDAQKPGFWDKTLEYAAYAALIASSASPAVAAGKWALGKVRPAPIPGPVSAATSGSAEGIAAARTAQAARAAQAARTTGTVARSAQVARTATTVARAAQVARTAATAATAAEVATGIGGASIGAIAGTAAAGVALGTLGAYGVNKGIDALMGSKPGEGLADRQFELDTYNPISIAKGIGNTVVDGYKKLVNWEDESADDAYFRQKRVKDADADGKKQTDKFDADFLAKGGTKEALEDLKAGRTPAGTPTPTKQIR